MDVVDRGIGRESDPFEDLDTASELQDLIRRTMPTEEQCTADEYISCDNSHTCVCRI